MEQDTNRVLPHTLFLYYYIDGVPHVHVPNNVHNVPSQTWDWKVYKNIIFSCNTVPVELAQDRFRNGTLLPHYVVMNIKKYEFKL